jgi:hypothetical protein
MTVCPARPPKPLAPSPESSRRSGRVLGTAIFGIGAAASADGAVFTVSNLNDAGPGSLRQALDDANGAAGADEVVFQAGVTGTITLTSGQLVIADSVAITGPGAAALTVSGNDASRVFYIYSPAAQLEVTISGLTITDGFDLDLGAGVANIGENLTLEGVVLTGNATSGAGGGLAVVQDADLPTSVTLRQTEVSGNQASEGGGVYLYLYAPDPEVSLHVLDSTITASQSIGCGGGIAAGYMAGEIIVERSTISGNITDCSGGGISANVLYGGSIVAVRDQSTLSDNEAAYMGGGVYAAYSYGTVEVADSVVSGNRALIGAGIGVGSGTLMVSGSTISDNGGVPEDPGVVGLVPGATYLGGGIAVGEGGLTVSASTIEGNAALLGGGVAVGMFGPSRDRGEGEEPLPPVTLEVENATISGNAALFGGGLAVGYLDPTAPSSLRHVTITENTALVGGGIAIEESTLLVTSSILAGNLGDGSPDVETGDFGSVVLDHSLVGDLDAASVDDLGNNLIGVDPELGPLANNGGPTETHLPAATSPALNTGNDADSLATDQRGALRPGGARVDMGAVELNPGVLSLDPSAYLVAEDVGSVVVRVVRTGGFDGAVGASFATSDQSAVEPGDYAAALGALAWADLDAADKTFNVAIVDDPLPEPAESVGLTLSNPTGGATLGVAAGTITIDTDPGDGAASVVEIPTLGDYGRFTLIGLVGLAGGLLLRRRRTGAAPTLPTAVLLLTLGVSAAEAAVPQRPEIPRRERPQLGRVGSSVAATSGSIVLQLADGGEMQVPAGKLAVIDRRGDRRGRRTAAAALEPGQAVVVSVRRGADGVVLSAKVRLYASEAAAKAGLARLARWRSGGGGQ